MSFMNVTEANFRPATPAEVSYAKGSLGWRCINYPWNAFCKTWSTAGLVYQMKVQKKDINPYEWRTSVPLRIAHNIKWYCGLAPERGFMETVSNVKGTWHLINSQRAVFDAFFAHNRNSDVFSGSMAFHALLSLIGKTFPETKFDPEDFMFTSSPEKNAKLHRLVARLVSGAHVQNNVDFIRKQANETLQKWADTCRDGQTRVNITEECRVFASKIISQLVFGMTENNEEVARAVNFINAYIIRRELKRQKPDDEANIIVALEVFKKAVNAVLNSNQKVPLFEAKDEDQLTLAEKQAMAFSIFFAGQETVAALMAYMFNILAIEDYQWILLGQIAAARKSGASDIAKQTCMLDFFARSIREFTPAYGVSRMTKVDVCLEFKVDGDPNPHKFIIYAGERITAMMSNFAKVTDKMDRSLYWLPFGAGPHRCAGENLARTEILEFFAIAIENYHFSSNQSLIPKQGLVTLQQTEDVLQSVVERKTIPAISLTQA